MSEFIKGTKMPLKLLERNYLTDYVENRYEMSISDFINFLKESDKTLLEKYEKLPKYWKARFGDEKGNDYVLNYYKLKKADLKNVQKIVKKTQNRIILSDTDKEIDKLKAHLETLRGYEKLIEDWNKFL